MLEYVAFATFDIVNDASTYEAELADCMIYLSLFTDKQLNLVGHRAKNSAVYFSSLSFSCL